MRHFLLAAACSIGLSVLSANAAEIVIKVRPPIAIHERRTVAPSPRHVWIAGYHRWDGNAYVWEQGRWEVPPRERAVWVRPHYIHRHDGWVFVEGHWS